MTSLLQGSCLSPIHIENMSEVGNELVPWLEQNLELSTSKHRQCILPVKEIYSYIIMMLYE